VNLGNDTTLCEGITKTLDASNPSSVYIWQNGSGGSSFTVNTAGLYYVAVNMNNCIKRDSIVIGYTYKPAFDLGKDTFICQGHQIILTPKLTGSFNYVWQDGSNNSTYTVNQPGSYQLTASNNCGSFTDKIVIDKGTCLLLMPNAFTPNNDGLNDLFRVKYPGFIKSFKMTVYNRWGEKIFETTNALTGWNGKYKGLDQPMGNYIWIISYTDIDGRSETLKGNVILIR
jgi:gliding motility-associated-like protein